MSSNIPRNVAKYSKECCQTSRGMSLNIPENVSKHSGECRQTFWGMLSNILENVLKHIFITGVTQGNEDVGSVQNFILLFLCVRCKSKELGGRGSNLACGDVEIPLVVIRLGVTRLKQKLGSCTSWICLGEEREEVV